MPPAPVARAARRGSRTTSSASPASGAQVEQADRGRQVGGGDVAALGRGAHRVVEPQPGVPQRVPEPLGQRRRPASAGRARPSCSSTRSRSLAGPASPRARLPTAASATPSARCRRVGVPAGSASPGGGQGRLDQVGERPRRCRAGRTGPRARALASAGPGPGPERSATSIAVVSAAPWAAGRGPPASWSPVVVARRRVGRGPRSGRPDAGRVRSRSAVRWLRARRPRARRCGPGRRRRPGPSRPCRRRSGRSGRS